MSKRFNSDRIPIHLERNGQSSPTSSRPTWAGDESKPSENHKGTKLMLVSYFTVSSRHRHLCAVTGNGC